MSKGGDTPLAAKIALWGGREIVGLLLVSLLAGTATIPYVAYHFHRISPYGVIANLMAMPATLIDPLLTDPNAAAASGLFRIMPPRHRETFAPVTLGRWANRCASVISWRPRPGDAFPHIA